jgi:hypothetical protein
MPRRVGRQRVERHAPETPRPHDWLDAHGYDDIRQVQGLYLKEVAAGG